MAPGDAEEPSTVFAKAGSFILQGPRHVDLFHELAAVEHRVAARVLTVQRATARPFRVDAAHGLRGFPEAITEHPV